MKLPRLLALGFTLALCGCGTMHNMSGGSPYTPYGGVRQDVKQVGQAARQATEAGSPREFGKAIATGTLSALDAPLSAVGDTVTLPRVLATR